MRKIKTLEDLKRLKNSNLPADYFMLIYNAFHRLYKALNEGEKIEKFSLEKHGYIVLLNAGDDLSNLSEIGLTQGLLKTTPESVTKTKIENFSVYQIDILTNNEFMLSIFISEKSASEEAREWLESRM